MYPRIVVPLDGSELAERAVRPASELAERFGSTITLVAVVEGEAEALDVKEHLRDAAARLGREPGDIRVEVGDDPARDPASHPRTSGHAGVHGVPRSQWHGRGTNRERRQAHHSGNRCPARARRSPLSRSAADLPRELCAMSRPIGFETSPPPTSESSSG